MNQNDSPATAPRSLAPFFVALAAFVVYALTACRTIYTGDDGDFATAAATLGVPHPTGYPLFVLIGKAWLLVTPLLGEVPFRLNLLTALFGAAAVGVLCRFLDDYLDESAWRRAIAVCASLLFAFTPTFWSQCTSCEVYSLNTLFITLLFLYSLRFVRAAPGRGDDTALCRLALLYGLALTNHLSTALFFPAFLGLMIWRKPSLVTRITQLPVLLSVAGCFLLPLALYLYLPIASRFSPSPVLWGRPDSPESFWFHVTGAQYRGLMFESGSGWQAGLREFFGTFLTKEFGAVLLLVAAGGIAWLVVRPATRPHAFLLTAVFVVNVAYSAGYFIQDIFVYYIPAYLAATIAIAGAASFLASKANGVEGRRYARLAIPVGVAAMSLWASVNYARCDKSGNHVESEYARNILRSCPQDAVLAISDMTTESVWYYRFVLRERPDVLVVSQNMFPGVVVGNRWYAAHLRGQDPRTDKYLPGDSLIYSEYNNGGAMRVFLDNALRDGRPVIVVPLPDVQQTLARYVADRRKAGLSAEMPDWIKAEQTLQANFDGIPWGVTQRLYPKNGAPSAAEQFALTAPLWEGDAALPLDVPQLATARDFDRFQDPIFFRVWDSLVGWGKVAEAGGRPDLAASAYERALLLYNDKDVRTKWERLQGGSR